MADDTSFGDNIQAIARYFFRFLRSPSGMLLLLILTAVLATQGWVEIPYLSEAGDVFIRLLKAGVSP